MILDYPDRTCGTCKGTTWWWSPMEPGWKGPPQWVCGTCSPPVDEKVRLRMRIIKGNHLLNKLRLEIWARPTGEDFESKDPDYMDGLNRLSVLCKQLEALSRDCVYVVAGKKVKPCLPTSYAEIECLSCPGNNYWPTAELEDKRKEAEK